MRPLSLIRPPAWLLAARPALATARTQIWSQIDRQVMSDAVILTGVYAKALLYRNPDLAKQRLLAESDDGGVVMLHPDLIRAGVGDETWLPTQVG